MGTKICNKCKIEKDLSEFYFDKNNNRYNNPCKQCARINTSKRISVLKNSLEYREKEKERAKIYYHTVVVPKKPKRVRLSLMQSKLKYENKYPEKRNAHNKCKNMKPKSGYNFHHWSYNEEHYKDVIEITIFEHRLIHKFTIYDQERLMYRTSNGVLLDTKESSIEYLKFLKSKIDV